MHGHIPGGHSTRSLCTYEHRSLAIQQVRAIRGKTCAVVHAKHPTSAHMQWSRVVDITSAETFKSVTPQQVHSARVPQDASPELRDRSASKTFASKDHITALRHQLFHARFGASGELLPSPVHVSLHPEKLNPAGCKTLLIQHTARRCPSQKKATSSPRPTDLRP